MIRRFARPYARALMEIVTDLAAARKVHSELASFESARSSSADLAGAYDNPAIDINSKIAITGKIAAKLQVSDLGAKVLEVLIRNHRINQLSAVLDAWKALLNKASGTAVADVRSAHALSSEEQQTLRASLEKKLGKQIDLRLSVDPSLLGGFVAEVESEVYDASVMGQIERFRDVLRES